jgi:hypothetical protein
VPTAQQLSEETHVTEAKLLSRLDRNASFGPGWGRRASDHRAPVQRIARLLLTFPTPTAQQFDGEVQATADSVSLVNTMAPRSGPAGLGVDQWLTVRPLGIMKNSDEAWLYLIVWRDGFTRVQSGSEMQGGGF